MKISQIMTRNVQVVPPGVPIKRAAELMDELNVGSLPVCDGTKLQGMITDRDIVVRAVSAGKDPNATPVSAIMTAEVHWCYADATTEEVMDKMKDVQIRRIPVVDGEKNLVGIVSLGDLATDVKKGVGDTLKGISEPSKPDRSLANP